MKKITIILLLLFPNFAFAIAFDASSQQGSAGTTQTTSHTITGTNPFLYVCVESDTGAPPTVTWNGAAMTMLNDHVDGAGNEMYNFYKAAPDTGTHDVVVSWGASRTTRTIIASYTGVDQTTPIDANTENASGSGTTYTDTITVITSGSWLVDCVNVDSAAPTASTDTVERGTGVGNAALGDSNNGRSAGSQSLVWTSSSGPWVSTIAAIKAVSSSTPPTVDTTATSSVDQTQRNMWNAYWVFFTMICLMLWLGRSWKS